MVKSMRSISSAQNILMMPTFSLEVPRIEFPPMSISSNLRLVFGSQIFPTNIPILSLEWKIFHRKISYWLVPRNPKIPSREELKTLDNTYIADEVSPEVPMGAARTRFLQQWRGLTHTSTTTRSTDHTLIDHRLQHKQTSMFTTYIRFIIMCSTSNTSYHSLTSC